MEKKGGTILQVLSSNLARPWNIFILKSFENDTNESKLQKPIRITKKTYWTSRR